LYGAFVWARRAIKHQKRRFPARAVAFLAGNQEGDNPLTLGGEAVNVKCFPQRVRYGGPKIATAFIEIAR
jgi:hypothetical protein